MDVSRKAQRASTTQNPLRGVFLPVALAALVGYGVALAVLPLPLAAGLGVGVFVVLAVMAQPLAGLALLTLAVPFGSPFNAQIGNFNFGPTEILFALTMAAWLGRKAIERELNPSARAGSRVIPPVVWTLGVFLFAIALTLTTTHSLPESLKELIKWAEVLLITLFTANALKREHLPAALTLILLAAAVEAAIGLYQTFTGAGPEPFIVPLAGRLIMRSYGTFEQPNPFAAYLNFSLPIAVSLMLGLVFEKTRSADRVGAAAFKVSPAMLTTVAALTLPVIAGAFFFSLSRGAWLGFALALVVMVALRSRRAFLLFSLLVLATAATLTLGSLNILPSTITQRIADIPVFLGLNLFDPRAVVLTDENFAIVDRMAHWFAAWNMFSDFPWLGVGIGNYSVVYAQYGLREWTFSLGHAHNFYLNMLAEAGLIGLAAYLLMTVSVLGFAWRTAQRAQGVWRAVAFGILGALTALSAHNFFDNLYVHGMNIQFGLLLGILGRIDTEE